MDKEKDNDRQIKRLNANKNKRIKMNNEMKKRLILIITILVILLIAIVVIVSRVTNQASANVGKQENNASQTGKNDEETEDSDEEELEENPQEGEEEQNMNQNTEITTTQENKTEQETYYIKVNNQANVVTVYKKDNNGQYTIPCKAMVCSVGAATPESGVYKTSDKYTWRTLFGHTEGTYVYGQYATRIVNSILFHSVPYQNPNDPSSLEYWEYDKLGTAASAGCVRLTVEDAKWIYDNCPKGTQVEFYSSADPGPLGKPTAQKISNEPEEIRGWDPTDPSGSNPWKTYNANKQTQQQVVDNSNTVTTTNSNEGEKLSTQQTEQQEAPSGGGELEVDSNEIVNITNSSEGTLGEV